MKIEEYFKSWSLRDYLRSRHPYDFRETYQILKAAYGYKSFYVNLGLWTEEQDGLDPAERLVKHLATCSGLHSPERLLDVGSGLGMSSVNFVEWLKAREVVGINLNERQLAFANELARSQQLGQIISHLKLDACGGFEEQLGTKTFDGAFAVECVGHFKEPLRFLKSLRTVLRPGAPFVFCLNVQKKEFSFALKTLFSTTYGFIPRSLDQWKDILNQSGFDMIEAGDITDEVLKSGSSAVLARLEQSDVKNVVPAIPRLLVRTQLTQVLKGVAAGELGYVWVKAI